MIERRQHRDLTWCDLALDERYQPREHRTQVVEPGRGEQLAILAQACRWLRIDKPHICPGNLIRGERTPNLDRDRLRQRVKYRLTTRSHTYYRLRVSLAIDLKVRSHLAVEVDREHRHAREGLGAQEMFLAGARHDASCESE